MSADILGQPRYLTGAAPILQPHILSPHRTAQAFRALRGINAGMWSSAKGRAELAWHEAIVTSPYYDSVRVPTIYIGHTARAGAPDPANLWGRVGTIADAMAVFGRDIPRYESGVLRAFSVQLTQPQFDAALSFHYNTGAIMTATWVRLFNKGDMAGARASFMNWDKPAAIIPRRKAEQRLFFDGIYSSNGTVEVYPADSNGRVKWSAGKSVPLAA